MGEKCPHFGLCGGCRYEAEPYEAQLREKEAQMKELFVPVLGEEFWESAAYEGVLASPVKQGYRNKMEFSFGNSRPGGPLQLGQHVRGRFFDVMEVPGCGLIHPDMDTIRGAVQTYFAAREVPFYHKKSHQGVLRHLVLRRSEAEGTLLVNLVTTSGYRVEEDFLQLLRELPLEGRLAGILHTENDSLSDAVIPQRVSLLWGTDTLTERILGLSFRVTPFSFFQTNTRGAELLYTKAREYIGEISGSTVYDLYSGTGTIAQILAPAAGQVIGVEIVGEAVRAAQENARLNGLTNCRFLEGDVLAMLDEIEEAPDYIVLDPPRDGVNPKALAKILRSGAGRLVYISCKPKSLARDIPMMRLAGYEPQRFALVDMFPNTEGIEAIALLSKTSG